MQACIKECKQAKHAAEFYEPGLAQNPAQGGYGEGDAQKDEDPVAGCVRNFFNGVCAQVLLKMKAIQQGIHAQLFVKRLQQQDHYRQQAQEKDRRLEPFHRR